MRFLLAGASGLIGTAFAERLKQQGHEVTFLVRPGSNAHPAERCEEWDPAQRRLDLQVLAGQDVVACFSGHNLMDGRWNAQLKRLIVDSRVQPTRLLADSLASLAAQPGAVVPRLFLSCSAVGIYGHTPWEDPKADDSPPGSGYLAEVCQQWEQAANAALYVPGLRTVFMRIGFVLSLRGGALSQTVGAFQRGIGGVLGSGRQVVSWIALDDLLDALSFTVDHPSLVGPVNYVAPGAVTNKEFTRILGQVLHKPTFLPIPAFAAQAKFGEVADELLLNGQRAVPAKLEASGFRCRYPDFESALRAVLDLPG